MTRRCSASAGGRSPGGMWGVERQTVHSGSSCWAKTKSWLPQMCSFKGEQKSSLHWRCCWFPWNMSGLLFHSLTHCQAEVFRPVHILQKFKGRKSERKPEHMTLLKDTPQLAFCASLERHQVHNQKFFGEGTPSDFRGSDMDHIISDIWKRLQRRKRERI